MKSDVIDLVDKPGMWRRLWQRTEVVVARFVLMSYVRSGWIVGDILYCGLLYAVFFSQARGNVAYFYGTMTPALGLLAVLDTIVIVQRSLRTARVYLPLARLTSRAAYMRGLLLASSVLRVPLFGLMLWLGRPVGPGLTLGGVVLGAVGLLLVCVLLVVLTVVLSLPVATRKIQIIFLVWLAAALYIAENTRDGALTFLQFIHAPLAPLSACYNLGQNSAIDGLEFMLVLLAVLYIVVLAYCAEYLLARRDLLLQ